MSRLVLIHWKPEEAEAKLRMLNAAGHEVRVETPQSAVGLDEIAERADAVVIDLSRVPSQGTAVGVELRRRARTRHVPIVFAGGTPEKTSKTRDLLPDAGYAEWEEIAAVVEAQLQVAPKSPVVPGTMSAYSGTPLAKKLGIRAGSIIALAGAPQGFEAELGDLPPSARLVQRVTGANRVLLFAKSRSELQRRWDRAASESAKGATIWVIWPKKASGVASDLSTTVVRSFGLAAGWVDYKICAINETWSGLAFSLRKTAKGAGA